MSEQILKDLIKINPELVNTKDKEGRPLIFKYLDHEQFREFKTLVELGADINIDNNYNQSLLDLLSRNPVFNNYLNHIKLLLERDIDCNKKDEYGDLNLVNLVICDLCSNTDVLQLMIDKTDNINEQNLYGNTVLHSAIINGRFENCKILLENGADPTIKNKYGDIPLEYYNGPNKSKYEELFKSFEKNETETDKEKLIKILEEFIIKLKSDK